MGLRAPLLAAALAAVLLSLVTSVTSPAAAAESDAVVNVDPPTVRGRAVHDRVLVASPGSWSPEDATFTYSYAWLRDGRVVRGADRPRYRLGLDDLEHRMSVRVTATREPGPEEPTGTDDGEDELDSATAVSAATDRVARAPMRLRRAPAVTGVQRFTHAVRATPGRWSTAPTRARYQWFRAGRPIKGATGPGYRFAPADVGRRVRVAVTVKAPGHQWATARSARLDPVRHRVDVQRVVRYHVETRGPITTSLKVFRRQTRQTLADPRGWRGGGVEFRPVARGGAMTLVLAAAHRVPGFSSGCSSTWSCRVGRYVIINQERWKHASPAWNAAGRALRDYRHMVVNHESGHFLGLGHAGCPRAGSPAPVMMQQSKGRGGCTFNPFPTRVEQGRV